MMVTSRRVQRMRICWGLCLGLIHAGTAAADTRAFVGARIFDGTGKAVIEKGTIVVVDGRIVAAGPSNKVKVPKGAQTLDVTAKTITPHLTNTHPPVSHPDGNP